MCEKNRCICRELRHSFELYHSDKYNAVLKDEATKRTTEALKKNPSNELSVAIACYKNSTNITDKKKAIDKGVKAVMQLYANPEEATFPSFHDCVDFLSACTK